MCKLCAIIGFHQNCSAMWRGITKGMYKCLEVMNASKLHAQVFCIFKLGAMQGSRLIRGTFAWSSVKFTKSRLWNWLRSTTFIDSTFFHHSISLTNQCYICWFMLRIAVIMQSEGHKAFICTNLSLIGHSKKRPVWKLCVRLNSSYEQTAVAFCNPHSSFGVLTSECESHYRSSISYTILPC